MNKEESFRGGFKAHQEKKICVECSARNTIIPCFNPTSLNVGHPFPFFAYPFFLLKKLQLTPSFSGQRFAMNEPIYIYSWRIFHPQICQPDKSSAKNYPCFPFYSDRALSRDPCKNRQDGLKTLAPPRFHLFILLQSFQKS